MNQGTNAIRSEGVEQSVKEAGEILLKYWQGKDQDPAYRVEHKADGTSVTEADYASNECLLEGIGAAHAEDGILSEEVPIDEALYEMHRVWIVDPLDGTQAFIDGKDEFSILVGLSEAHQSIYGIMYFPARQQFCVATKGGGAFCNEEQITVSTSSKAREGKVYVRNCEPAAPEFAYPVFMDSGLAFINVANGTFDGAILRLNRHKEWDLAAPTALITEAGGKVSDEHGNPIRFADGGLTCKYFVASNGLVHDELLKAIKTFPTE